METVLAVVFTALMVMFLGLHFLSMPANFLIMGMLVLWKFMYPAQSADMNTMFFVLTGGLVLLGEALEFISQLMGAKKYGGTKKGNLGGIIGAICGAIIGAPFFLGLGALLGALGGAYAGCLIFEIAHGRELHGAMVAAKGAFYGKFLGMSIKFGVGVFVVVYGAKHIWT
ncbi:DUF456 domain-containing protein [Halodesulfovibrio marinisediminis]|uniref:DUF456 domain-containing protein n=1 Tax=Halodesulfovibrio marinisediminis DSM 17456 TaxID=1121457 RepID=A0A1N6H8C9_9BACT|nr:DUF456 domain-containing protein [Halodesulfovibrio marinisediminis]SIO16071.1 hypothetical protein SAMN02745161_2069 [Halodesulfovibrio marinisediminis DSM 17456]